tara:strand:+ start:106 stop:264 length:159 start_codon:yes stop_codon:yes gene_type:complete
MTQGCLGWLKSSAVMQPLIGMVSVGLSVDQESGSRDLPRLTLGSQGGQPQRV